MSLTNISDCEIRAFLVSPAADTMPGNTTRDIIERWEQIQNSVSIRLIAGSSAPPAIITYPGTSRIIGYGLVKYWEAVY